MIPEPNPPRKPPTNPKLPSAKDKVDIFEYDKTHAIEAVTLPSNEKQVLDILIRICDACHEIQNVSEPWASIRKDIEKLR